VNSTPKFEICQIRGKVAPDVLDFGAHIKKWIPAMKFRPMLLLALFSSTVQLPVALAQSPPLAELDRLIAAGQYQEAYSLAISNLEEWEGDTDFDLLFGIAALESGSPNESIFAFERVAATGPNNVTRQRARLELARAHLLTNNLVASENLFNQVLQSNPPANVRENIEAFLALIEARRNSTRATFSFSVAPIVGYDDNINSATSNGLIDTPLIGEIELNSDGLKTSDDFVDLSLNMNYRKPLTRDRAIDIAVALNRHDNRRTDQFDMDYVLADISYGYGGDINRFRHSVQAQKVYLDQEGFQKTVRFNNSWQRAGSPGWYQSLSASVSSTRYDTSTQSPRNDLRDSNQILLSGTITRLTQSFTNSFTLFLADDKARNSAGKHNGRSYYGVAHSILWRYNNRHTPYARISIQQTEYDDEHPVFFQDIRDDTTVNGALGWTWQYSRQFSVNAEMGYTDAKSNIPLFGHTRLKYQAGFRYQL
jgi:hypothetical protein